MKANALKSESLLMVVESGFLYASGPFLADKFGGKYLLVLKIAP